MMYRSRKNCRENIIAFFDVFASHFILVLYLYSKKQKHSKLNSELLIRRDN